MTTKKRITQLEKTMPKPQGTDAATMRPSEILARAEKLIQQGCPVTEDILARVESLRVVTARMVNQ